MNNEDKVTMMVKIFWFDSAVTSKRVSNGVYENPETGEVATVQARLIRRQASQGGNSWEVLNGANEWHPTGDRPVYKSILVTKDWFQYNHSQEDCYTGHYWKDNSPKFLKPYKPSRVTGFGGA